MSRILSASFEALPSPQWPSTPTRTCGSSFGLVSFDGSRAVVEITDERGQRRDIPIEGVEACRAAAARIALSGRLFGAAQDLRTVLGFWLVEAALNLADRSSVAALALLSYGKALLEVQDGSPFGTLPAAARVAIEKGIRAILFAPSARSAPPPLPGLPSDFSGLPDELDIPDTLAYLDQKSLANRVAFFRACSAMAISHGDPPDSFVTAMHVESRIPAVLAVPLRREIRFNFAETVREELPIGQLLLVSPISNTARLVSEGALLTYQPSEREMASPAAHTGVAVVSGADSDLLRLPFDPLTSAACKVLSGHPGGFDRLAARNAYPVSKRLSERHGCAFFEMRQHDPTTESLLSPEERERSYAAMWSQVDELTPHDMMIFLCLSFALVRTAESPTARFPVSLDWICEKRGIKPKPGGGYRAEDRERVYRSLCHIHNFQVCGEAMLPTGRKGKLEKRPIFGPLFLITCSVGQKFLDFASLPVEDVRGVMVTAGDHWGQYLFDSCVNRQFGWLLGSVLSFDPLKEAPEIRLSVALARFHRIEAGKQKDSKDLRVSTILEHAGLTPDARKPARTFARLSAMLEKLERKGVIAAWTIPDRSAAREWTTFPRRDRGWKDRWLNIVLRIEAPEPYKLAYSRTPAVLAAAPRARRPGRRTLRVETLRARRVALGVSQVALAEAAEVSQETVSRWERGKGRPTAKEEAAMRAHLDAVEQWARKGERLPGVTDFRETDRDFRETDRDFRTAESRCKSQIQKP